MARVILVSGGAGFIGSHVCERLVSKFKVVCVDDFNSYYSPKVKEKNISGLLKHKNFVLYKQDIRNYNELKKIIKKEKVEKIVHLAARAGVRPSIAEPNLYNSVNIIGTINLLELAKEFKIKNFVFASSSSVYGVNASVPFSEDDLVKSQISPYGVSKIADEYYCYCYHKLYGLSITCLRFFTVYGPRGRPDMAPYIFVDNISKGREIKMFGKGDSYRDYTYVSDIVEGVVSALNKNLKFEIINLGCGNPVSLKKFISIIEKEVGRKAKIKQMPMQKGDVPRTYASISKARKLLGYKPKVKVEVGIKKLVEWYRS